MRHACASGDRVNFTEGFSDLIGPLAQGTFIISLPDINLGLPAGYTLRQ